jgi:hydrogenase maturation protease
MTAPAGPAETALIVTARLPGPLEALRLTASPDARRGLPAHVTLLYPFAGPATLDRRVEETVAAIVERHRAFPYRLIAPGRWPDVLYASVDPAEPFRSLHRDLAAAFPEYPIYGGGLAFEPHVTVAEGPDEVLAGLADDPAWATLPAQAVAASVDLIVQEETGWTARSRWRLSPAVRVLVCGERLRGDDAAAGRALDQLDPETRELAEIAEVGQLSVEALIDVPDGVAVIVADAVLGAEPGSVVTLPLEDVARGLGAQPASSHSLPPDQVIALAEELRGTPLEGTFVGIGGAGFAFGEELSPPVEAGLPAFTAALAAEIWRLAAG